MDCGGRHRRSGRDQRRVSVRLFAIPFLHKLTGSRIAAVILPAFFWSLHSAYPQEPGYIRGIEVG